MVRHTRTRHLSLGTAPEGFYKVTSPTGSVSITTNDAVPWDNSQCDDSVGTPITDSAFVERITTINGTPGVTGSYTDASSNLVECQNALMGHFHNIGNQYNDLPGIAGITPDDNTFVTQALARSNPSRPGFSPLGLLQDLYDMPKLLRDCGKYLRRDPRGLTGKDLANWNLMAQFGWMPMVSDLKNVLNLHQNIQRRLDELNRLTNGNGLRRRINLGTFAGQKDQGTDFVSSAHPQLICNETDFQTTDVWAVCHWQMDKGVKFVSDTAKLNYARALASGMTGFSIIKGAWDLIPWTWLLDWFSNVSDYAIANADTVPAHCRMVNLCLHTKVQKDFRVTARQAGFTGGNCQVNVEFKKRRNFANPVAHLAYEPMIGSNRLSILASLFVQRLR